MNKHTNRRMLVDSMKNPLDIEQQINRETRSLYAPKPGAAREERPRFPFREPGPPHFGRQAAFLPTLRASRINGAHTEATIRRKSTTQMGRVVMERSVLYRELPLSSIA